jgi:hypothetical protein
MNMNISILVNLIAEFLDPGQMFEIVYYCQLTAICQQTNIVHLDTDFNLPCSFFFPLSFWEVVELLLVCVRILREHGTCQTIFDCCTIYLDFNAHI